MKRTIRIFTALATLSMLTACGGTDWNHVYSGMSNNGYFRE